MGFWSRRGLLPHLTLSIPCKAGEMGWLAWVSVKEIFKLFHKSLLLNASSSSLGLDNVFDTSEWRVFILKFNNLPTYQTKHESNSDNRNTSDNYFMHSLYIQFTAYILFHLPAFQLTHIIDVYLGEHDMLVNSKTQSEGNISLLFNNTSCSPKQKPRMTVLRRNDNFTWKNWL